eukprot:TRINITY_DN7779_c0_g1_i1.p1 TRINITY_DN7779_c0_g1~~TRINITY_DN7779_c0_g1_i1.p1  ORF type:complete len:190 (-),score=20.65 TRINITY_DN7779_c0_g1_i1:314-817(-)
MDFRVQNTFIHYRGSTSSRSRVRSWPPALMDHYEDPKDETVSDFNIEPDEKDDARQEVMRKTVLMIGNLPCRVNFKRLEAELHLQGFRGTYDHVHVPTRANGAGRGYGFVHFAELADANRFVRVFDGYLFLGNHSAKKVCYVVAAAHQGRAAVEKRRGPTLPAMRQR